MSSTHVNKNRTHYYTAEQSIEHSCREASLRHATRRYSPVMDDACMSRMLCGGVHAAPAARSLAKNR